MRGTGLLFSSHLSLGEVTEVTPREFMVCEYVLLLC